MIHRFQDASTPIAHVGLLLALLVVVAAVPGSGRAQGTDKIVNNWAETAAMLFREGDYDRACALYLKAFERSKDPVLLYNAARVQDRKGDPAQAIKLYQQYLAVEKSPEGQERGQKRLNELRERIPQRPAVAVAAAGGKVAIDGGETIVNKPIDQTGFLVIKTEPSGAMLSLNGKELGKSPLQLEQAVGRYVVIARLGDKFLPARQELDLSTTGARLTLVLPVAPGRLQVASEPTGVEVWLDGEKVGITPVLLETKSAGRYRMLVKNDKYLSHEEAVDLRAGETTSRRVVYV